MPSVLTKVEHINCSIHRLFIWLVGCTTLNQPTFEQSLSTHTEGKREKKIIGERIKKKENFFLVTKEIYLAVGCATDSSIDR